MEADINKIIRLLKIKYKEHTTPTVTKVAEKRDPFKVLISCILSLRTKDGVTDKAVERLFSLAETPEEMLKLTAREIERAIYPVGFYKTKAKIISEICLILIEKYNSKVPSTIDDLLKLKGVGRKTANIVITLGYNKLGIAVDTHVHRISNRLGLVKTNTPEQTEFELRKILPKKHWIIFNNLLVTHGQNICVPISPKCSICSIINYCQKLDVGKHR